MTISVYDLARDIATRLKQEPQVVEGFTDEDGETCIEIVEYETALIVEQMIGAALRSGGIDP